MDISIIGSGYVGLVAAAGFLEVGHSVICVDVRQSTVDELASGRIPIHEPGLEDVIRRHNVESNSRFRATTDLDKAVLESDVTFICVGTPFDGIKIDLSFVEVAAESIGRAISQKKTVHTVVVKSTVVPGTTDGLVKAALELTSCKQAGKDFGLAMNPEFLREGSALSDFNNPDRIVLGGDELALSTLREVYEKFENANMIETSSISAELIKYCSNSFFAMLISFANEFSNLSAQLGADGLEVINGLITDRRFSSSIGDMPDLISYLKPGCGYGGSCFPKDIKALESFGRAANRPMEILRAVDSVNEGQAKWQIDQLKSYTNHMDIKSAAVLGLAFKSDTDDIRESPGVKIARILVENGLAVKAFDSLARSNAQAVTPQCIDFPESLIDTVRDVDCVFLVTPSAEFDTLPDVIRSHNPDAWVFDCRRRFEPNNFNNYLGAGYPG